jgi:hypothetical protein
MSRQATIPLTVGNIIPKGDTQETAAIIQVWQDAGQYLQQRRFVVENPQTGQLAVFLASLDVSAMLELLQQASRQSGSLDAYRRRHATNPTLPIGATLNLSLEHVEQVAAAGSTYLLYHTANVFFQQLMLGINLSCPGACQLLSSRFSDAGAHRYEAQDYDSRAFHDGKCSSLEHTWPPIQKPAFQTVWNWMEAAGTSERNTAITTINKVLIDLLKLARQRDRYGARTALLVANQLELLLGTRADKDLVHARERTGLIMGYPPESADCFKELYRLKQALMNGAHPVKRPALVYHHAEEETLDLIKPHNSGVEKGFALIIALLQTLITHNAQGFQFTESMSLLSEGLRGGNHHQDTTTNAAKPV